MPKHNPAPKGALPPFVAQGEYTKVSVSPIPDANELQAYVKVRPDLPDLLIEEWRIEAKTRRDIALKNLELAEREVAIREKATSNAVRNDVLRLLIGAVFVVGAFFLAWELVKIGKPEPAIAVAALPAVAGIISAGLHQFLRK